MNHTEKTISVAEAKSTLESLAKIKQDTNVSIRAPLWLNFIISCSYGMGVFSWASTRHENQWMLGVIASVVVFVLATAFYLYSNRLLGVKPKLVPKSKSEYIFNFLVAIFFGLVVALSREFSKNDIWWVSYAGAAVAALSLAYIMHKYPSGDFNTGRNKND
ncbi:MAG: hypothetical protein HRT52_18830 [Colwellia sp.]|nr:hypothetical protein [Colwellia sp.]